MTVSQSEVPPHTTKLPSVVDFSDNLYTIREVAPPTRYFIWHLDGYNNLKPSGFCIHSAIDGYSRRILWCEVGPSNNDPMITVQYCIDCARQYSGFPRMVRGDCGTENIHIAAVQRFLRWNCQDRLTGARSFMYGKSVANQRIEAWCSFLKKVTHLD